MTSDIRSESVRKTMAGTILALDPSSTLTGYAVFAAGVLVDAGVIRSERSRDDAETRIDAMCDELAAMVEEVMPEVIVIEVPSGRPGRGLVRGAGAHLTIYGVAVGEIRRVCKHWASGLDCRVVSTTEREWTASRTPKRRREEAILHCRGQHPQIAELLEADTGYDCSDAIGVGLWFMGSEVRL